MPPPREQSSVYKWRSSALPVGKKKHVWSVPYTTKPLIVFQANWDDAANLMRILRQEVKASIKHQVIFLVNWFQVFFLLVPSHLQMMSVYILDLPPQPVTVACFTFGGDCYWVGGRSNVYYVYLYPLQKMFIEADAWCTHHSKTKDRGTRAHPGTSHDETMRNVLSWIDPGWSPSNLTARLTGKAKI